MRFAKVVGRFLEDHLDCITQSVSSFHHGNRQFENGVNAFFKSCLDPNLPNFQIEIELSYRCTNGMLLLCIV